MYGLMAVVVFVAGIFILRWIARALWDAGEAVFDKESSIPPQGNHYIVLLVGGVAALILTAWFSDLFFSRMQEASYPLLLSIVLTGVMVVAAGFLAYVAIGLLAVSTKIGR